MKLDPVREDLLEDPIEFRILFYNELGEQLPGERTVLARSKYEIDLNRLQYDEVQADLNRFMSIASELIASAQKGVARPVQFVEDFHPELFAEYGKEVITWSVMSRRPANMDTKASSRPQRRPMYSYNLHSPDLPNKVVEVQSMPKDHLLKFSCWSEQASLANRRALWLERLFIDNTYAFKVKGVERFHWDRRESDQSLILGGQRLYERPLVFFARLRDYHSVAHPEIESISVDLQLR